ncbi:MEI2-like protein 6 [Tanacetum coccineum]|uniref:MEI2-like protein 6 n=1 Tax=Tanacetum coccineum TaxID=301880 RepID=A0ABQ5IAA1_9ASTR
MNTTQRELIFSYRTFIGSSVDERGKTHHGKSNLFQETPKPLCSTFLPTDIKHCLNVGYTFVNFTTSEAVWKSHVCITRKSWPLFKSKKIAQVVRAWIQSKNSLVKHFEDMRLCRPSKESMSCLTTKGMRNNGAKCASSGKVVSISEALIRTDLNFDDADGIDSLPNQAIFDAIQRMGYEGDLTDEGASSERLSDEQPSPSPAPTSEVPYEPHTDSSPAHTSENLGDHSSNDTSLLGNEDDMTLQNVYDLLNLIIISERLSPLRKDTPRKASQRNIGSPRVLYPNKEKIGKKRIVAGTVQRGSSVYVILKISLNHMETENAQISTDEQVEGTEEHNEGTEEQRKVKSKAASKEKEKEWRVKDVEEIDRPRPTSQRSLLTLKPLPKIDHKDKGKKKIEEEDES